MSIKQLDAVKDLLGIEKYLEEVPEDVIEAISSLSDNTRLAIVVALLKHGELTFSQLMDKMELTSSTLSHHLKILQNSSMVVNSYKKKADSEEYSFYDLTEYGEKFMRNLYGILDISETIQDAVVRACFETKPYEIEKSEPKDFDSEGIVLEYEKVKARILYSKGIIVTQYLNKENEV